MPGDKKDDTDVLEQIEPDEPVAKEAEAEPVGHDPHNSIPNFEKPD